MDALHSGMQGIHENALHSGAAVDFFWLCATTSETTVTKDLY
jgi:hypothetical protein